VSYGIVLNQLSQQQLYTFSKCAEYGKIGVALAEERSNIA
jgi:hypothetical protein